MAFINKTNRTGSLEEIIGRKDDGSLLQGELDIFKRIEKDCSNSCLDWYCWYDLSLPIQNFDKHETQIDFLLICEKGAIVLEVKGGGVCVYEGRYYYSNKYGRLIEMEQSPFDQAKRYKHALIKHDILNKDMLIVEYAVAFPHQAMEVTNKKSSLDESYWLWDKNLQDSDESIADFFEYLLDEAKKNISIGKYIRTLTPNQLKEIIATLSPSLEDKGRYTQSTLSEVLQWLHLDNLNTLEGLSKNRRILIEGGPGTGKTTMAKAFIKKNCGLKGLYLCKNIFLAKKFEYDLIQEDLYNCKVDTFGRFLASIGLSSIDLGQLESKLETITKLIYDYVIIDEAQDIADQGLDIVLDKLTSPVGNGLSSGRYMIFYDIEQGYNSNFRNLESLVDGLLHFAAHFKLNENKRVISNSSIVENANKLLHIKDPQGYSNFIDNLQKMDNPFFNIVRVDSMKLLSRAFRSAVNDSEDKERTVVLVHSFFKYKKASNDNNDFSVYEILCSNPGVHELTEKSIENPIRSTIPLTSILKYKGLETNKVILILPTECPSSNIDNSIFEIYVGITRAMMNLHIILL